MALGRIVFLSAALLACGSSGDVTDAGPDVVYGHKSLDASVDVPEAEAAVKVPWNRMQPHGAVVLSAPHIVAVYIGQAGVDGASSVDAYFSWLVTATNYWGPLLAQYGVGYGTFDGSVRVDAASFFKPGMVNNGLISWSVLDQRIAAVIHAPPSDAGVTDSGGSDAGDAGPAPLPAIPVADAYIFFLPDGVNVDLGQNQQTCMGVGGYHEYDQQEPYSIIPPCGRHGLVLAHELAEMVTDPEPGLGWFSDQDLMNGGGEIGDLCNYPKIVDGNQVTALWSNKDGDCEPQ